MEGKEQLQSRTEGVSRWDPRSWVLVGQDRGILAGGGGVGAGRTTDGTREWCPQPPCGALGLMVILLGRLFRLLYWWAGTTWYRLTTAASLLDVFVLTR